MMFGRKMMTAGAAALAVAAMSAVAWAQDSKAPVIYSVEQNLCRAACGDAWVKALSCRDEPASCRVRADKSYKQCLPDCAEGKSPMSASFAWSSPKESPVSRVRAASKPQDDGPDSTAAAPWVDARTQWEALPSHASVALPHTFTLPTSAYGYGGVSNEIRPFVTRAPGLLKVELVVIAGKVGVSLATPSGSDLVSKEAAFDPSPAVQVAYFEVGPQTPPAALVVRNYDEDGRPGSVTVRSVTFARAAVLPAGEAQRLGALK